MDDSSETEQSKIVYSSPYVDDLGVYEFRHVEIPRTLANRIARYCEVRWDGAGKRLSLLNESEWREYGLQMSPGWEHFEYFGSSGTILLFRRRLAVSSGSTTTQS